MSNGNFLYELLRRLNKSEKQKFYDDSFKRKRGRYANYVQLFDAVTNLEHWDDEALLVHFKGSSIAKNLTVYKRRLYLAILHALNPASKTDESVLYQVIEIIRFLFRKALYHQSPDFFDKGFPLALDLEDFSAYITLCELASEGKRLSRNPKVNFTRTLKISPEGILESQIQLTRLKFIRMGIENELAEYNALNTHEFQRDYPSESLTSKEAWVEWHIIQSRLLKREGDYEGLLQNNLLLKEKYGSFSVDSLPLHLRSRYLSTVANIGFHAVYLKKFELAESIAQELDGWNGNAAEQYRAQLLKWVLMTNWKRKVRDFAGARHEINEYLEIAPNHPEEFPRLTLKLRYSAAISFILEGDYKSAIKQLNSYLSERPDIEVMLMYHSKFLFALCQVGIRNWDQIKKEIRFINSFAKRYQIQDSFHSVAIKFLKSCSGKGITRPIRDAFLSEVKKHRASEPNSNLIRTFDWEYWLNQQFSNLP